MKLFRTVPIFTALAVSLCAQNPPGRTSSSAVDNEHIRVTKVTQQPHQKTRPHQHNMNRVMVYLTPGSQVNDYQDGKKEVLNFKAGEALWSAAGGIHVAEVTSAEPITIVEMELRKPTGKAMTASLDPLKVDPKHYKLEFENSQVRVIRVKIVPHETVPLHEHMDRVAVYLTGQNFRVTEAGGNVHTQTRNAGDVAWGDTVKHSEVNSGDEPFEALVVELK